MTEDSNARLVDLQAQVKALVNLTLSHIVASNVLVEGLAAETISHATIQRDSFIRSGANRAAVHLDAMLDGLRFVCDLPADD